MGSVDRRRHPVDARHRPVPKADGVTPAEALNALYAALETVGEVLVVRGVGVLLDPPAVAVGPPRIFRGAYDTEPTEAGFQVGVVVKKDEHAMDELLRLEQPVVDAINALPGVAVQSPTAPGTWPSGGVDLPAYLIDVAFPL